MEWEIHIYMILHVYAKSFAEDLNFSLNISAPIWNKFGG